MKKNARYPSSIAILVFCFAALSLQAEDILFIGNSFTFTGNIPKMVESIAIAKGKTASTLMVTTGGKDWGWHLKNPATENGLKAKPWNWVVLQDYSIKATHAGNIGEFKSNGAAFYDRIVQASPQAGIVLYQTWAFDRQHAIFTKASKEGGFTSPDQMIGEIEQNFSALQVTLKSRDPKRRVLLAPVGAAFARCVRELPDIKLYGADFKHPSLNGSYLSALVIYATIFQDSPVGTPINLPKLNEATQKALQTVAAEVTQKALEK